MAMANAADIARRSRSVPGRVLRTLAACLLAVSATVAHAEETPLEQAVKATYLLKFAPFVTWPPSALLKPGPFALCLSGTDAVTDLIPQAASGQKINGQTIAVRHLADTDNPQDCQILYLATSAATPALLAAARGKPILTVTDGAGPVHGIVQFTVVNHHVHFNIDTSLAADTGLVISSKLLSLADVVTPQAKP
jgi:hypothetical protein